MECECFTFISIGSLLIYKNKYHLQVYLDNCAYKNIDKELMKVKELILLTITTVKKINNLSMLVF